MKHDNGGREGRGDRLAIDRRGAQQGRELQWEGEPGGHRFVG